MYARTKVKETFTNAAGIGVIRNKKKVQATCHPNQKNQAHGLCHNCYLKEWKRKKRRSSGIRERRPRPTALVVYAYFDSNGVPLYVGRGRYGRALEHRTPSRANGESWVSSATLLLTMTCKDEWESMEYEGKWGGRYRPIANIDGNRNLEGSRSEG